MLTIQDVELEQMELFFGDAAVDLYRIKSLSKLIDWELDHCHSYYEIHFILQGYRLFSVENRQIVVKSGEGIIIGPEVRHKPMQQVGEVKRVVISLTIKKRQSKQFVHDILLNCLNDNLHRPIPLSAELIKAIESFDQSHGESGAISLLHRKMYACNIAVGLFETLGLDEASYVGCPDVDFDIALEAYVEHSTASLKQIAEKLGYSQRHISRKIKERFGKSFSQIRKGQKIK